LIERVIPEWERNEGPYLALIERVIPEWDRYEGPYLALIERIITDVHHWTRMGLSGPEPQQTYKL